MMQAVSFVPVPRLQPADWCYTLAIVVGRGRPHHEASVGPIRPHMQYVAVARSVAHATYSACEFPLLCFAPLRGQGKIAAGAIAATHFLRATHFRDFGPRTSTNYCENVVNVYNNKHNIINTSNNITMMFLSLLLMFIMGVRFHCCECFFALVCCWSAVQFLRRKIHTSSPLLSLTFEKASA